MFAFIARRTLAVIPVLGVVAVFVFLLLRLSPGDPAAILAGETARPEDIERIRAALGLDKPIWTQFVTWLGALLQGDLGISIHSRVPVATLIAQRLEPTLALASTTIVASVLIAVPLGVIAAWQHGSWIDRGVMVLSVLGF